MPLALRLLTLNIALTGWLGGAAAQDRVQVVECSDLMAHLAERDGAAAGGPRSIDRLEVLLRILLRSPDGDQRPSVHTLRDRSMILVRGAAEHQEAAARAVAHLRRLSREARLQCTLVTLPVAAARELGLQEDRVVTADETAAGAVFKAAQRHKGTLQNLPEATVVSLRPFLVGPPPRADAEPRAGAPSDAAQSVAAGSDRAMRVRGEALVLPDEAVLLLQVVRGPLANLAPQPRDPVLQVSAVVARHAGALTMVVQGEQAVVLWVRLADVVDAADAPDPAAAPKK